MTMILEVTWTSCRLVAGWWCWCHNSLQWRKSRASHELVDIILAVFLEQVERLREGVEFELANQLWMDLTDVRGIETRTRVLATNKRLYRAEVGKMAVVPAAVALHKVFLAGMWKMPSITVVAEHEVLDDISR